MIAFHPMESLSPEELASFSQRALDRPLDTEAELCVARIREEAIVLGGFQRGPDAFERDPQTPPPKIVQRQSGGALVHVGTGTLYVSLSLSSPSALVPCETAQIVNRYVRPLLRGMAKVGAAAHYFGRDWVSLKQRPVAFVGFAHDASTTRTMFEALIAVSTPFAPTPRDSFLGHPPGTLESIAQRSFSIDTLRDAIAAAYSAAYSKKLIPAPVISLSTHVQKNADPPWTARVREAIGDVCAGEDAAKRMRIGGEFMASRDAITNLEAAIARLPRPFEKAELANQIDIELGRAGVALYGVRSLSSLCDALAQA